MSLISYLPNLNKKSLHINRKLQQEAVKAKHIVRILLLGTGESGKSTVVKQMKIIHMNGGFSQFFSRTGEKVQEVQIHGPPKSGFLLVIVLSCPIIGSLSSSTANQRAAQNTEPDFGVPGFVCIS